MTTSLRRRRMPTRAGFPALLAGLTLLASLLGGSPEPALAQGTWTTFLNAADVRSVAPDGDGVWVAGNGGALRLPRDDQGTPLRLVHTVNGLNSNHLTAVHVGPDGSVWFGTQDQGLSRWDRRNNRWETVDFTLGLPGNNVTSITDDGQFLWVGTTSGFALLSGDTVIENCASLQDSCLPNLQVVDIVPGVAVHGVGPYYFATAGGVVAFDGNRWVPLNRGLPPGVAVRALAQSDTSLYAAAGDTLYRFLGPRWTPVVASADTIFSLRVAGNRLYVGRQGGVSVLEPGAGALTPLLAQGHEAGFTVRQMLVLGDSVWATSSSGPQRYAGGLWQDVFAIDHVDEPALNNIESMMFEPCGSHRLWMTGHASSIAIDYDPSSPGSSVWGRLGPPLLASGFVFPVLADHDCFLWFGHCCSPSNDYSQLGGDLVDARSAPFRSHQYLDPPHNIISAAEGPDGKKWFGSGGDGIRDGLYVFSPRADSNLCVTVSGQKICSTTDSTWQLIRSETYGQGTLPSNRQRAFAFRGAYDRWIGTDESGLVLWHADPRPDSTRWVQFNQGFNDTHTLVGNSVRSLQLQGDSLWVGTTQGLSVLDARRAVWLHDFGVNDEQGSLPSNTVTSLAAAPNGDLWIGTLAGVVLRRNGTFTTFNSSNSPLVSDEVHALAVDTTQSPYHLWIGTVFGINRLAVSAGEQPCSDCPPTASSTVRFYPHPFRPGRSQMLSLAGGFQSAAAIRIYDTRGLLVRSFDQVQPNQPFWDGRDSSGQLVGSGLYRVRVESDGVVHRMVLAVIR